MFDIFPSLPLFGFLVGEGLKYATRSPQQWAQEGDQIITPSGRQENLNSSPPFRVQNPWVFFGKASRVKTPRVFVAIQRPLSRGSWLRILSVGATSSKFCQSQCHTAFRQRLETGKTGARSPMFRCGLAQP